MTSNPAPEWLRLLAKQIDLALPATVPERVVDARVPILQRILREVALPAVTVDRWGVRAAVEGVIEALPIGGALLAAARVAAGVAAQAAWGDNSDNTAANTAAYAAAYAARSAAAADAAAAATAAATTAYAARSADADAAAAYDAAAWAASAARANMRAIVLDELRRLEGGRNDQ